MRTLFLSLIKLGIGTIKVVSLPKQIDWNYLEGLAARQGLSAILVDGVEKLPEDKRPPKKMLLQWIGEVLQIENNQAVQWKAQCELALLLRDNEIKTYVLKGVVISECYPNPTHRQCVDMDCFLESFQDYSDVWEKGNKIIEERGFKVERRYYKNSTWFIPGLTVENHRFITPFRGNNTLKKLERLLQTMLLEDNADDHIDGTWLFRPPVMVSALLLIEHAYSHFLHEGLTWRHVLDWMMFSYKHHDAIDWDLLNNWVDEYGFRRFYDSFLKLGKYLMGEISEEGLTSVDKMMLEDVWAKLDIHGTVRGVKGKLALAGNTWRARWKYQYFTEMSWIRALWIQVKGFLFMRHPKLNYI